MHRYSWMEQKRVAKLIHRGISQPRIKVIVGILSGNTQGNSSRSNRAPSSRMRVMQWVNENLEHTENPFLVRMIGWKRRPLLFPRRT
jgi:hypothetical protein